MAAQNRTTLVIDANTTGAESGVRRLATEMSGAKRLATDLATEFNYLNSSITGTHTTMGALRNLMGTLGFGIGIHELTQYMDAWVTLEARLKLVTNTYQELKTAKDGVFEIAQETRASLKDTGDLYYKTASGTKELHLSQKQILENVKAVNNAILLSGSNAESSKAALVQWSQALQSNRLGGDELRSIAEQSPRLLKVIRKNLEMADGSFGATGLQFKLLAAEGFITTEKMVKAVARGAADVNAEASKIPLTIEQAWTKLNNEMMKFVGEQGQSTGVFSAVSHGIELVANNINHLINTLGIGIASWAAFKAASSLSAFGETVSNRKSELIAKEIADTKLLQAEKEKQILFENAANATRINQGLARSRAIEREIAAEIKAMNSEKLAAELAATHTTVVMPEYVKANRAIAASMGERMAAANNLMVADKLASSTMAARMASTQAANVVIFENIAATQAQTIAAREQAIANSITTKTFEFMRGIIPFLTTEFNALTAAMMRNPFTAAAVALTAVATAAYAYRDSLIELQGEHVTLGSAIKASWETITEPSEKWFHSMGNYIDELINKFEPLTAKIKSLVPDSVSAIDSGFGIVSDFMMGGGLLKMAFPNVGKKAAENDAQNKLTAELEKAKDQKTQEELAKSGWIDKAFEAGKAAKNITSIENFNKEIKRLQDEKQAIIAGSEKDIATTQAQILAAKNEDEKKRFVENLATLNRLRESGIQYEDSRIAEEMKKRDEFATRQIKSENNLQAEISAKRKNMTAAQESMLEGLAQQYQIPPAFLQGLATIESAFKPLATSEKGAKGLFQVMPFNFDKIGASMKDVANESVFTAKSMKLVADVYQKAGGDVEKFWMIWNSGHLSKSIELAPPETRAGLPKLLEAIKQAGGDLGKLNELSREQEQAAKKIADEKQRIYENTAIGKYITDMEQLNRLYGDDRASVTYQENAQKIADTFLKSTVDLKAYNDELERHKKHLENVGDYNSTIDELTRNKNRGAITSEQYGLDVAKANAGLMNDAANAYPNAKIPNIPIEKAGEVIDKKNINDAAKETQKFHDEITKTTAAFDTLGNSGKMAFDGLLGGISAVASAATSFGEEMTKLNDNFAKGSKDYSDYMMQAGLSEEQRKTATADYYKMKDRYESASFQAEISGARQIAGATAKMFSEKSAARKVFHGIEMGLAVVEMAMSAKKMVVDVAAGAANMFAQGGFAGFAGVAAMAAVMGGLGFAMSSGSKPAQDDTMKASVTTGTVLGDPSASSNSIKNIIQTLNDIHAKEYPELKATADAFRTLGGSVDGFIKTLAQGTQSFTNFKGIGIPNAPVIGSNNSLRNGLLTSVGTSALSGVAATGVLGAGAATFAAGGLSSALSAVGLTGLGATVGGGLGGAAGAGAMAAGTGLAAGLATAGIGLVIAGAIYGLGKLLGIGKTKITQLGEGFVINSVNMFQDGMEGALNPQTFAKWEAKTKGWFSDTKKIIESFGNLSDDMKGAILDIYIATKGAILASSTSLGLNDLLGQKILDYATPNLKIDWFKIKTEKGDVGKYISDTLNTMTDNIATDIFGNLLGSFQDMGEGMLETIARLGSQYAIVSSTLGKYGEKLHATDMGMIGLSDSLVRMYSATGDAKEGLKNFIDVINSFYDAVVPQGVKSQKAFSNMSGFAKKIGIDEKDLGSPDVLKAAIFDNFEKKKKLSDEAAIAEAELTKQREAVNNFYNPKTSTDLNTQLDPVWAKYSKTTDWANFQFSDLTNGFTEELVRSRALEHAGTSAGMLYNEIIRVAETNAKNKAAGLASGGNKWLSVADLEASIAPLTEKLKTANENLAEVTALTPDLKEWEKAVTDLADNYQEKFLNLGRTDAEKIAVERAKILKNVDGLDFDFAITKGFEPIIKAMRAAGIEGEINAKKIMEFTWAQEDAAKSVKKLADATKYFDGFTRSIKDWIQNLKATQLGSPESQFNAAKDNFAAQMKIINGGLATSAEEKQAALSGITGVADTYIAAIRNNYASTEKGQELIAQVVEQVSGLTTNVDVQQLQLGVLQQIRDGVHALPLGISDTQKTFFESLSTKIDTAQKTYIASPTSTNDLIANTLAKEWTIAVDAVSKGKGFLDALIKSFDGDKGLNSAVNLIIDDKSLNAVQAQTAVDNVLRNLKVVFIDNEFVAPNFLSLAQKFIDQQIDLIKPPPIYLSIDTTGAIANIDSVIKYATDATKAISASGISDAANSAIYTQGNSFLESKAVNLGYSGDYSDIAGMTDFIKQFEIIDERLSSKSFVVEPKIGGGIPADSSILKRLSSSSNAGNSSSDTKETVEELKKQTAELTELVKQTTALLRLQIAANQELVEKMNSMDESLKTTAKKTRLSAVSGAK